MGQRLCISIEKNGGTACNVYYHWSAYTFSAIEELLPIIKGFEEDGITEESDEYAIASSIERHTKALPVDSEDADRNNGLIAVSAADMQYLWKSAEYNIAVDLTTNTFSFDVVTKYELDNADDKEEFLCWKSPELLERIKTNPEYQMSIDLREVPLSVDSIQMLDELLDKPYLYYAPENTVIVPIC
jgi:hypothetical protein